MRVFSIKKYVEDIGMDQYIKNIKMEDDWATKLDGQPVGDDMRIGKSNCMTHEDWVEDVSTSVAEDIVRHYIDNKNKEMSR